MTTQTLGDDAKSLLRALDDVLGAVEKTAWSLRAIYGDVQEVWGELPRTRRRRRRERGRGRERERERAQHDDEPARAAGQHAGVGVGRLVRTGITLGQIVASYRLHRVQAAFLPLHKAQRRLERLHELNAARFYDACVEHGGAFVKVGQVLSARADLMPKAYVRELSQLQDAVPSLPWSDVREAIEQELGRPLAELFASVDETALAAASIGQVHLATTHAGERVALKVRRPGIEGLVRADLELLETFLLGLRDSLPALDYETIVAELKQAVVTELDYTEEARMTEVLREALAPHAGVTVPRVHRELSSDGVLATSFIEGTKLTHALDELQARGEHAELSRLLGELLHAYLRQILTFGAFQADPHPGNLLVTPDGKLVILDFGCTRVLGSYARAAYVALLGAFVSGDRARMGELLTQLGFETRSGQPDSLLTFADALLAEFREALAHGTFRWPDREQMLERASGMLRASQSDPVTRIPADFVLMARVLGTLGGLFAHYRPDIAFAEHVLPVLGDALLGAPAPTAS